VGQVEKKRVIVLMEPYLAPVRAGRGEPDWLEVVEVPAAVVDAYLLDPRPSLRQIGAHRDSQLGVADRGMRVSGHRQRADTAAGQDARGHRLVALGPAPAGVYGTVEQGQLERPGRGAFGQDRQVPGGDPAISRPQLRMIGKRPGGQEGRHRRRQVIGPFQGQAGEPEHLHQRPDQQRVLPDAVNLAQQQQTRLIQ
jgi:hypothetical protein